MNAAWTIITLANGVGTANWSHPDQTKLATATTVGTADPVALDDVPPFLFPVCTLGNLTNMGIVQFVATKTGLRIVSTHNADSATYFVTALVKLPSNLYMGQR